MSLSVIWIIGGNEMRNVLVGIQFLICIALIAGVLLQPGKSAGLSGAIAGGAEQLFGKKKSKGYEVLLSKATTIIAILFMIMSVVLVVIK